MDQNFKDQPVCSFFSIIKTGSLRIAMGVLFLLSEPVSAEKCEARIDHTKCLQMITTAKSGLRLRESFSTESKVIASIPYNSTVYLDYVSDVTMNVSGLEGNWVKICWKEKAISGYVFSGFLKKKKVSSFRFSSMYQMISSGSFAEGEEAEINIGNLTCPENLKQEGNNLDFFVNLPPAFAITFSLTGANNKIALEEDCGKKCIRLTVKISKLDTKPAEVGQNVKIKGQLISIRSIKLNECKE